MQPGECVTPAPARFLLGSEEGCSLETGPIQINDERNADYVVELGGNVGV